MIPLSTKTGERQILALVWDWPLRIFHWCLAGCLVAAWLTTGDSWLDFHLFIGYLLGGLLLFRLGWGLYGEPNSRFRDFTFGWRAVRSYLASILAAKPARFIGHNPAGSWAIYLLLLLLLSIAVTGLLTLGGEEGHGPLAGRLNISWGVFFHQIHEALAWAMLGMVGIHLLGVVLESLLHQENLIASMVTGNKWLESETVKVRPRGGMALFLVLLMLLFAGWWFKGYLSQDQGHPYLPLVGPELPDNSVWRDECGACHLAYHPSLLPARSWGQIMEQQADHFEEDLALEPGIVESIQRFLTTNSAEHAPTEVAWKINHAISTDEIPLRITESTYWKRKHSEIKDAVWTDPKVNGRWNCDACHLDAAKGTFEDGAMVIPGS